MERELNYKNKAPISDKMETYIRLLEIINQSTDDFLFVLDIENDENYV